MEKRFIHEGRISGPRGLASLFPDGSERFRPCYPRRAGLYKNGLTFMTFLVKIPVSLFSKDLR